MFCYFCFAGQTRKNIIRKNYTVIKVNLLILTAVNIFLCIQLVRNVYGRMSLLEQLFSNRLNLHFYYTYKLLPTKILVENE